MTACCSNFSGLTVPLQCIHCLFRKSTLFSCWDQTAAEGQCAKTVVSPFITGLVRSLHYKLLIKSAINLPPLGQSICCPLALLRPAFPCCTVQLFRPRGNGPQYLRWASQGRVQKTALPMLILTSPSSKLSSVSLLSLSECYPALTNILSGISLVSYLADRHEAGWNPGLDAFDFVQSGDQTATSPVSHPEIRDFSRTCTE